MGKSNTNDAAIDQIMDRIDELILLLRDNNVKDWDQALINLKNKYAQDKDKKELAKILVKVIGGGIGSLADITLQLSDGTILPEDDRYQEILDDLYAKSKKIITQ